MFSKAAESKKVEIAKGVKRAVLASGGSLMTVEVCFDKGGVGALHSHVHEQISYVVSGSIEYTIGNDIMVLCTGDSCYVPSGAMHGVLALEESKLIDVFTPQREDFLD